VQVKWTELLGTRRFSKDETPVKPLAAGAPVRDSNFEDAVSSFVYTARMPFHPQRLHDFIVSHFNLHQKDWGPEMAQAEADALTTIQHAAQAMAAASKMLPAHHAPISAAAELAATAANAAARMAEAAGHRAGGSKDDTAPPASQRTHALECQPFGKLLRSKGFFWLAGPTRTDHCGDWSLAGDVLQLDSGGPWIAVLPLKHWPEDDKKRREILRDIEPGIGDRCEDQVLHACCSTIAFECAHLMPLGAHKGIQHFMPVWRDAALTHDTEASFFLCAACVFGQQVWLHPWCQCDYCDLRNGTRRLIQSRQVLPGEVVG
jgi:hypothetical protein